MSGDNLTEKTQKKDPFTSLHMIKENLVHWAELEIVWNGDKSTTFLYCFEFDLQYMSNIEQQNIERRSIYTYRTVDLSKTGK